MNLDAQILSYQITKRVSSYIEKLQLEPSKVVNETAVEILTQIQEVFMQSEIVSDDFLLVERIIEIFHQYGLDTGCCHDF